MLTRLERSSMSSEIITGATVSSAILISASTGLTDFYDITAFGALVTIFTTMGMALIKLLGKMLEKRQRCEGCREVLERLDSLANQVAELKGVKSEN